MIHELRTYHIHDGRMDAILKRFKEHAFDLFRAHGITVDSFWRTQGQNVLVYVCSFTDTDAMRSAWEGFRSDPKWQQAKASSEADGAIVARIESAVLEDTDIWPG